MQSTNLTKNTGGGVHLYGGYCTHIHRLLGFLRTEGRQAVGVGEQARITTDGTGKPSRPGPRRNPTRWQGLPNFGVGIASSPSIA